MNAAHAAGVPRRHKYLILALFSGLYFAATCFRASRKLFWFDELFTLYMARLPDMGSIWSALKQGVDLNPPLFYGFVKWSESLFGEGHVGTRLPAILGFWICCLCVFRFVSSRTTVTGGIIGMLFPMVTTAYFYAYEARPHGIVFGCAGLALICWQAAIRDRQRTWWLVGLFASLLCAVLNHPYAILLLVPLGMAESVRSVMIRRIDWAIWLAMVSSLTGVLFYLPLLHAVKAGPAGLAQPSWSVLADSYQFHLGPSAGVLAASLILYFCFTAAWPNRPLPGTPARSAEQSLSLPEVVALIGFVAMPFFSFLMAKVAGVPFYSRYSIAAVIGFSCIFGAVISRNRLVSWGVIFVLLLQIAFHFYDYAKSDFIREPSISLPLSTRAREFAEIYRMMDALPDKTSPIVLLGGDHEFLPIMHYAPENLASRLVFVLRPGGDSNGNGCMALQRLCGFPGRCERMADFLGAHDSFYARGNSYSSERLSYFIRAGADVRMESMYEDSYLATVRLKPPVR